MPDGYFLAPAGLALWQEVRESGRWPGRETESDGWIGDPDHESRTSDHNPCWSCSGRSYGIVRAVDLDVGGWPALAARDHILARCRSGAERRVAYIISNRQIASATHGWAWRAYGGENPHTLHTHYSLKHDDSNFDGSPWLATFGRPDTPEPPDQEEDDDMQFLVTYQGIWLVAGDLSTRTGFSSMTDLNAVVNAGKAAGQKYASITLTAGQMARIPIAGAIKADLSDEDLAQAAELNADALGEVLGDGDLGADSHPLPGSWGGGRAADGFCQLCRNEHETVPHANPEACSCPCNP